MQGVGCKVLGAKVSLTEEEFALPTSLAGLGIFNPIKTPTRKELIFQLKMSMVFNVYGPRNIYGCQKVKTDHHSILDRI